LGVVEDFAGVGFGDARCGFAEGDVNVDFVGKFQAVALWKIALV
jgi:hypothetical protein